MCVCVCAHACTHVLKGEFYKKIWISGFSKKEKWYLAFWATWEFHMRTTDWKGIGLPLWTWCTLCCLSQSPPLPTALYPVCFTYLLFLPGFHTTVYWPWHELGRYPSHSSSWKIVPWLEGSNTAPSDICLAQLACSWNGPGSEQCSFGTTKRTLRLSSFPFYYLKMDSHTKDKKQGYRVCWALLFLFLFFFFFLAS